MQKFLYNLKLIRERNGLTQQDLAKLFHISQQSVHKYENNKALPTVDLLCDMSEYFHTSTDYLLDKSQQSRGLEYWEQYSLSFKEQSLIQCYKNLSIQDQWFILDYVLSHCKTADSNPCT